MSVLLPAIKKAGKNPTWDKVYKNILASGKGAAAYMSNGEGQFAKGKPYYATQVHVENLQTAAGDDAEGRQRRHLQRLSRCR